MKTRDARENSDGTLYKTIETDGLPTDRIAVMNQKTGKEICSFFGPGKITITFAPRRDKAKYYEEASE